jgi:hypothetical protein
VWAAGVSLTRQMGQAYSGSTSASAMCEELMEMLRRSRTSIIVALFAEKAFFSSSVAPLGGCASRTSPATAEAQPYDHAMHCKEPGSIDVSTGGRCRTVSAVTNHKCPFNAINALLLSPNKQKEAVEERA